MYTPDLCSPTVTNGESSTARDIFTPDAPDSPSDSLEAWTKFLTAYANGKTDAYPTRPPLSPHLQERLNAAVYKPRIWPYGDAPLYDSTTIEPELANTIREFYCDHAYLPPPRAPLESQRNQCIREYDIFSDKQIASIQQATDLLAAVFPDTLVTFSLFQDRIQTHFALSGPTELIEGYQLSRGLRVPSEDSLCGHAVLLDRKMMFIPDLQADWRFQLNPFAMAGFKSFVGYPVSLEVDPLLAEQRDREGSTLDPEIQLETNIDACRMGVGTINICFVKQHQTELSESQKLIINRVGSMLETQLRASWEGDQRRRDIRARSALSDYIEEALVENSGHDPVIPLGRPSPDPGSDGISAARAALTILAESAAKKITRIVKEADSVSVWDLRAFSKMSGKVQYFDSRKYPLQTIATVSEGGNSPQSLSPTAVLDILTSRESVFNQDHMSGLESTLPPATSSHLALSFWDATEPIYLILVTNSLDHYTFPEADVNFVRNIGSILLAKSIQARILEADSAKTSFLSAISHELRTPMHALTHSQSLIQEAFDAEAYDDLGRLLELSASGSRTLTNILNDVLDFGKDATGYHRQDHESFVSNLADTTVRIFKITRTQYLDEAGPVDLIVEYEDRDWGIHVDEARFSRVLLNGLTNAMKFCQSGSITVRLTTRDTMLVIQVIDTGAGFDEALIPQMLQAFTKLDQYSAGAGLGLHITKTLVERAGGRLRLSSTPGLGTTFEATIPATFTRIIDEHVPRSLIRKVVRDGSGRYSESGENVDGTSPAGKRAKNIIKSPKTAQSPDLVTPPPSGMITNIDQSARPLRVLVADDNVICRKLLAMTLNKISTDIEVRQAENGQKSISIFTEWHPDLVLTDVSMPVMDGITSAGKMREYEKSTCTSTIMNGSGSGSASGSESEIGRRSRIYAITALGSTDPRSKSMGMNGSAALDGWLVKGQDLTAEVTGIVDHMTRGQSPV